MAKIPLPHVRPLEDQTDEEFLDEFVKAFRGSIEEIKKTEASKN
jgi:hypothetical protein